MMQYRVDFGSLPWTTPMNGVRQKVFKFGGRQLRLVEYSKIMKEHWCERRHVGYVLDGKMRINFENETVAYAAGDGVVIPAGSEHKHMANLVTDTVTIVFVEEFCEQDKK